MKVSNRKKIKLNNEFSFQTTSGQRKIQEGNLTSTPASLLSKTVDSEPSSSSPIVRTLGIRKGRSSEGRNPHLKAKTLQLNKDVQIREATDESEGTDGSTRKVKKFKYFMSEHR